MSSPLDRLHAVSVSGVPMRPKPRVPEPTVSEAITALANTLAQSQEKLVAAFANVVASQPRATAEPPPRGSTTFDFDRGADGLITGGAVSNGQSSWRITVTRTNGALTVQATPHK